MVTRWIGCSRRSTAGTTLASSASPKGTRTPSQRSGSGLTPIQTARRGTSGCWRLGHLGRVRPRCQRSRIPSSERTPDREGGVAPAGQHPLRLATGRHVRAVFELIVREVCTEMLDIETRLVLRVVTRDEFVQSRPRNQEDDLVLCPAIQQRSESFAISSLQKVGRYIELPDLRSARRAPRRPARPADPAPCRSLASAARTLRVRTRDPLHHGAERLALAVRLFALVGGTNSRAASFLQPDLGIHLGLPQFALFLPRRPCRRPSASRESFVSSSLPRFRCPAHSP